MERTQIVRLPGSIANLLFHDLILELYQWHAQTTRGEVTSSYQNCSDKNIIYNKVLYMHSNVYLHRFVRGSSAKRKTNDFFSEIDLQACNELNYYQQHMRNVLAKAGTEID